MAGVAVRDLVQALRTSVGQVSRPGRLAYTERQLYYELCRTLRPVGGLASGPARVLLGIGLLPAALSVRRPRVAAGLAAAGILAATCLRFARSPQTIPPPISYERFAVVLAEYRARFGAPPGLIAGAEAPATGLEGREPDLADYGLARALVCQSDHVARMLRANRFHLEAACAVLGLSAATPLHPAVGPMLARVRGARVYFLHDASPEGLAVVPTLRERLGLDERVGTTALGLRPVHAARLSLFATRASEEAISGELPANLSPSERAWLNAGWRCEAEAVAPARLLRSLKRAMDGANRPRTPRPGSPRPSPAPPDPRLGFLTWPAE